MATAEHWTFEKKIPVAVIVSLGFYTLAQTFAFGWWASSTSATLNGAVARIEQAEKKIDALGTQAVAIAELRVKTDGITQSLVEIKDLLRQRPARP